MLSAAQDTRNRQTCRGAAHLHVDNLLQTLLFCHRTARNLASPTTTTTGHPATAADRVHHHQRPVDDGLFLTLRLKFGIEPKHPGEQRSFPISL